MEIDIDEPKFSEITRINVNRELRVQFVPGDDDLLIFKRGHVEPSYKFSIRTGDLKEIID